MQIRWDLIQGETGKLRAAAKDLHNQAEIHKAASVKAFGLAEQVAP